MYNSSLIFSETGSMKLLNVPKLIKTIWIMLWIILLILVIMKICINVWYPITTDSILFTNICTFIDNHIIIKQCISIVFYTINVVLLNLTTTKCRKYKNVLLLIVTIMVAVCNNIIKRYNNIVGMGIEVIILLVIPIIYNLRHKTFKRLWLNIVFPIIINVLLMIWQIGFLYIRNIKDLLEYIPTLINVILQLDYYIFLIITWLGVVYFMSTWGVWFFRKDLIKLEAIKLEELKKEHPDKDMLREIDKHIAILKTKKA